MSFFHRPGYGRLSTQSDYTPPTQNTTRETDSVIVDLRHQCARLHMQVQTLARLLIAKGVMEESELDEWMSYVDSLDGVADGKLRPTTTRKMCPSCNRANVSTAATCQWCGHELNTGFLDPGKAGEDNPDASKS